MANFRNSAIVGLAFLAAAGVTSGAKAQGVIVDQSGYNNTGVIDGVRTDGLLNMVEHGNNNGAEISKSTIHGGADIGIFGDNNTFVARKNPNILGPLQVTIQGAGNSSSVAGVNQRPFATKPKGHHHG